MSGSSTVITIQEILNCLPHRPPFLLIDRVIDLNPGKTLTAIKNVTMNEPFFVGHFPEHPVMPGVLILEAMAQASSVLAARSLPPELQAKKLLFLFAGIDNARFKRMVIPGDQLKIDVEVIKVKSRMVKVQATASVEGEVACSAELMSITKEDDR